MKPIFRAISAAVLLLVSSLYAAAQGTGPQIFLTWRAQTYVPAGFPGKILPTANSIIVASVALIQDGKIADLSQQTIYWYANDEFVKGGVGAERVAFRAPQVAGGAVDLRVEFPNYRGATISRSVPVPVARPAAVIEAAFPGNQFSSSPITLKALPYFFNVDNPSTLSFSWRVNDSAVRSSEEPRLLNLTVNPDTPSGTAVTIDLGILNPLHALEGATARTTLIFVR